MGGPSGGPLHFDPVVVSPFTQQYIQQMPCKTSKRPGQKQACQYCGKLLSVLTGMGRHYRLHCSKVPDSVVCTHLVTVWYVGSKLDYLHYTLLTEDLCDQSKQELCQKYHLQCYKYCIEQ